MTRAYVPLSWSLILLCGPAMAAEAGPAAAQPAPPPCILTVADTMEKVFRDEPSDRPRAERLVIEAARNEVEGIQLVVAPPGKEDLRGVTVEITDLAGGAGVKIPKANVTWNLVGYVETEKPNYPVRKVGWWPDPLLSDRRFDVKAGQVQPVWINVRVPADAKPGTYHGNVVVRLPEGQWYSVPLEVHVWSFAIPKQQHLETCFPLRPGEFQQFYKLKKLPIEMYEEWIDFCLSHRISVNLCDWPDFNRDMERLVARQLDGGGSAFCLAYAWFTQGKPEDRQKHNAEITGQIKKLYDRAKGRGWIPRAYIYCHDEIGKEQFTFAHELYGDLKKAMPDLRLMQTFYKDDPIPALDDVLDVWAPVTARYRPAEFQAQQAKGDGVWWYVCCGPGKPFANLMIEWPAVDHRVLLWQNWKYHVDGFLYWGLNVWRDNMKGDRRWPEVPWNPATFRNDAGKAHNGDGQLIYPGPDRTPLSSIRLENLRDGIEDYEYFWLLRDAVAQLKKGDAAKHQALIAEAEKALAVDEAVVKDMTHFTDDAETLRRAAPPWPTSSSGASGAGTPVAQEDRHSCLSDSSPLFDVRRANGETAKSQKDENAKTKSGDKSPHSKSFCKSPASEASNMPDMGTTAELNMRGPARGEDREDGDLVARFRAGERGAFDELVLAHQERVVRLVYRLLGRAEDVDDVVQEVFLSVLVSLKRFRGECRFSTWLTRIVINKCRSHGRWRLRRLRLLPWGPRNQAVPAAKAESEGDQSAQAAEDVCRAVNQLPAKYREPVVLRYFEDLSVLEIGEALGLSANAVEVRLTRARQKLKRMLVDRTR